MKKIGILVFLSLFPALTLACNSPILDHETADSAQAKRDPSSNDSTKKERSSDSADNNGSTSGNDDSSSKCPLEFPKSGLCASMIWDNPPVESRENTFTLKFWNKDSGGKKGPYVDPPHEVFVDLWMKCHNHGSAPVKISHHKDSADVDVPGIYDVSNVYFIMKGPWEVRVKLVHRATTYDQAETKLDIN